MSKDLQEPLLGRNYTSESVRDQVSDSNVVSTRLFVRGICCPSEIGLCKELLLPVVGVLRVDVQLALQTVHVDHSPHLASPALLVSTLNDANLDASLVHGKRTSGKDATKILTYLPLSGFCALTIWFLSLSLYWFVCIYMGHGDEEIHSLMHINHLDKFIVYLNGNQPKVTYKQAINLLPVAAIPCGWKIYRRAIMWSAYNLCGGVLTNSRGGGVVGMSLLASIVVFVSCSSFVWRPDDAALLIALLLLSEGLQECTAMQNSQALEDFETKLIEEDPTVEKVTYIESNMSSVEEVKLSLLRPLDFILIRPGAIVPVDGTVKKVLSLGCAFNEAIVTGESRNIEKVIGSNLIAGSVCVYGGCYLQIGGSNLGFTSTYSRIVRSTMKEAESEGNENGT